MITQNKQGFADDSQVSNEVWYSALIALAGFVAYLSLVPA